MSKLYVFGIGGTGSRVIRSLTMLLASGVELYNGIDTVIPLIIDPDASNGDLTRTVSLLRSYQTVNENLKFANPSECKFFKTKIDDLETKFKLSIVDTHEKDFQSYINYLDLDPHNKALVSLLFTKKNLEANMEVGFKGNPNMGSVVLNNFDAEGTVNLESVLESFQLGDRIFIISSIFGGTGAAGFPLLLKTLRNASENGLPNSALIETAPIGAISVLPYFGVKSDDESEIQMETFLSKTKSALSYYSGNIDTDVLYYISDRLSENYENNEGSNAQVNKAHFVELASALAIVDFTKETIDGTKLYKEFGVENDKDPLSLKDLSDSTRFMIEKPLISFFIFERIFFRHLNDTWDQAWAKDFQYSSDGNTVKGLDRGILTHDFFVKLKDFLNRFHQEWLVELHTNSRGFSPFNLDTSGANLFNAIHGYEPNKSSFFGKILGKNLEGFDAIDDAVAVTSNDLHKRLPMYDYFMDVHWKAINKVLKKKLSI